ncbi:hypothetical protein O5D80_005612 [Batrachochytrium dendrobatidis]|nr:hypothetical protein O5D80_005612 [Batrachochytrium dendrobatidis]
MPPKPNKKYQQRRKHARRRFHRQRLARTRQEEPAIYSDLFCPISAEETAKRSEQEKIWLQREAEYESNRLLKESKERAELDRLQRIKDNWGNKFKSLKVAIQAVKQSEPVLITIPACNGLTQSILPSMAEIKPIRDAFAMSAHPSLPAAFPKANKPIRSEIAHLSLIMQSNRLKISSDTAYNEFKETLVETGSEPCSSSTKDVVIHTAQEISKESKPESVELVELVEPKPRVTKRSRSRSPRRRDSRNTKPLSKHSRSDSLSYRHRKKHRTSDSSISNTEHGSSRKSSRYHSRKNDNHSEHYRHHRSSHRSRSPQYRHNR